jgi:2-oxoglutarate dehydrogenase E1 component
MQAFDFINRANAEYIDQLYRQYQRDPRSVEPHWQAFFAGFDAGASKGATPGGTRAEPPQTEGLFAMGVYDLVHTYREIGHFVAKLDPLGHDRPHHPLLNLAEFGLTTGDLDKQVVRGSFGGEFDGTLRDLIEKLRLTYCRTIGVEFMDLPDKAQRDWLISKMEPIYNRPDYAPAEQRALLFQLIAAEEFERFLHTRYIGQKRFSLEGAEALIPLMNTLIDDGSTIGVEEVVMCMAHRGRLNVLAHVMNKPYEVLLSEFEGTYKLEESEGDGDVKYHLGYTNNRPSTHGHPVHLLLTPNPSHLELVNPVHQGIVRSKQTYTGDKDRNRVVPIQIHGDAAFSGQGIVQETLALSEMPGYRTGGTIHIIVNNQIGFTATPKQTRFTPYPTDIAKSIQAPIFHVNGDDPEAVVHAAKLAIGFREQFKMDVIIDLWCYRRHGHNETDEPGYTSPVMYHEIERHKSTRELYAERLVVEGRLSQADLDEMREEVVKRLTASQALAKESRPRQRNVSLGPVWKGMTKANAHVDWGAKTAVAADVLKRVAEATATTPPEFTVHPKLQRLLAARRAAVVETGKGIDWGTAETLAAGSLLLEGHWVRITGQDVERGTFSHRHAILYDYNDGSRYVPLAHLSPDQGHIIITNTILSEMAVLGFEYGYTLADPRPLVIWEAQFGDFVNGAQPIIDQFIAAGESKWQLMSGLVLNLPHGYEGQGPEHSNAYLDRFLALCAEENMQVCVPTTSAQYFHLLRRQIHRKFRKPLVNMTPKSLLRFEPATSTLAELAEGAFHPVIDDPHQPDRERVRRVLLCAGKVYYTLAQARQKQANGDVAIVRVEQLYPFPQKELAAVLSKYRRAQEVGWVQEEPKNRGAWSFMDPRLRSMLTDTQVLNYHGRDEAASPATGTMKMHQVEEQELIAHALDVTPARPAQAATAAKAVPASAGSQQAVDG